ncbi:MAG: hypothetical protein HOI65_11385 [Opitutae bacterium]|nr:hypothetical protein [Opitutae bacterium]
MIHRYRDYHDLKSGAFRERIIKVLKTLLNVKRGLFQKRIKTVGFQNRRQIIKNASYLGCHG